MTHIDKEENANRVPPATQVCVEIGGALTLSCDTKRERVSHQLFSHKQSPDNLRNVREKEKKSAKARCCGR